MKQNNPLKERRKSGSRLLAAVLSLAMILTMANPATVFAAGGKSADGSKDAGVQTLAAVTGDGVRHDADPDTTQEYTLGDPDSTRYDGRVWVDKSVSKDKSVSFGGDKSVANNSDFLVTYSALATSTAVQGDTPVDVVFVLDLSASMCWGTRAQTVTSKEDSRIKAMVDALNENIAVLAEAGSENRIGVAVFNGTGRVLMPLTKVSKFDPIEDGQYFSLTSFSGTNGQDNGNATVTCNMNGKTADTAGGTNVQAGLYQGMKLLANEEDTTFTMNGQTVVRIPNVVIMSDGAPTTFASPEDAEYREEDSGQWQKEGVITNKSDLGSGTDTQVRGSWWQPADNADQTGQIGGGDNYRAHSADGFMALATASYMKNKISANYYGKDGAEWGTNADNTANVYTIGFSTDQQTDAMSTMANIVLNPEDNLNASLGNSNLGKGEIARMWTAAQDYLKGGDAQVYGHIGNKGNNGNVPDKSDNGRYDWDDMQLREFIAQHPKDGYDVTSFNYPTQYFSANDTQGLIEAFEEIAGLITSSASAPTEVTGDPMEDGYITYTDTTGKYMEIRDVTTLIYMDQMLTNPTIDNTEAGVRTYTFEHKFENPAYPGQTHNTSEIQIKVTDNGDHTQTIEVKIPASAIPLRTNTITLNSDGTPSHNQVSEIQPMRLCYEIGLEEGINAATLSGVDSSYIKDNTENGIVNFYSNAYTRDGETNNGVGAVVEFEPSPDNPFYFIQGDTPIYVQDSTGAGYVQAKEFDRNGVYYIPVTYYNGAGDAVEKVTDYVKRSGETLEEFVEEDENGWFIKDGSPRIGNLQDVTAPKTKNETATYGNYREPTFVYDNPDDTDVHDGSFVVLLGNNGRLGIPFMSKDVSLTGDSSHASIDGQLVSVGGRLHYTISWVNTATQDGQPVAGTVTISDRLPAGTTYVEDSAEPASGVTYDEDQNILTWTIEADAGGHGTVEFDAEVGGAAVDNENNALPNTATVTAGSNSYTTNTTTNYVPEKSVTVPAGSGGTADADGAEVEPGTELTYTIEYRNTESAESTVTITDAVPERTTFVSAEPEVQPDQDGNLEWTIKQVPAGQTGSVSFTVKVDDSAAATIENEANVKVGDHNPVVTNKVTTEVNRASLTIAKKVTADSGLTAPDKEFGFELIIPSKANAQNVAAVIHTEGADDQSASLNFDADGKATFRLKANQSLEIPGMGSTQYSVVEQNAANGAVNGGFTLSKVEGATGAGSADNPDPTNDVSSATAAGTVGSDNTTVTFTNNYSVASATTTDLGINLGGTKNIDGRDFQTGDAFTFTIAAAQATPDAPLPEDTKVTINPESGTSAAFGFGKITFDKPGEYRYIIQEVNYDTDNDDATKNPGGIGYDAAIYRVNIVIVDNGDGTLRLATTDEIKDIATQGGLEYTSNPMVQVNKGQSSSMTGADNNEVVFENTYDANAATASIQGTKILTVSNSDYTLEDGDFKFTIEALGSVQTDPDKNSYTEDDFSKDDSQPMPVDSKGDPDTEAANIANGNVSFQFAQGAFTKDMAGRTFGYRITESAGDIMSGGVTYDPDPSRIVWITVGDDGHGNVTATVMPNDGQQQANNFTFNNSYEPDETTIGSQTTAGITVQKTFTGHAWTEDYTFEFEIEPVSTTAADIEAEDMPMPDSPTISIGAPQSGDENTASFGTMTFSRAGDYVYRITELDDSNAGTTCSDTDQTVTVKVTEDKNTGKLSAEIVYEKDQKNAAFVNTYTATFDGDTAVTLTGTKNLEVADGLVHELKDGDFSFRITALDGAPAASADTAANEDSTPVQDTNDWTSGITLLNRLTFDMDDMNGQNEKTFSYVITENLPSGIDTGNPTADGITYDTTAYKADIKVTDDGKGTLSAADPLITKGTWDGSSFTADGDPSGVNGVVFTNSYAAGTLTQTPVEISKTLNGNMPEEGQFTFSMSIVSADPEDGVTLPQQHESVANDASGKVQFGDLTFSKPGTYVVEITEDIPAGATNANVDNGQTTYEKATEEQKAGSGWTFNGTTYDSHSVRVTFKVKDNGNGTLVPDGNIQTTGETVFANTYAATGELSLGGTKTLEGRDWVDGDDFIFTLTGKNVSQGADENSGFTLPDPSEVTVGYSDAVEEAGADNATRGVKVPFSFDKITFSQAGTYEFTITESGYSDEPNVSNTSGTAVTYTYTVTDDGNGHLTAAPVQASQSGTNAFVNTYNPGNATAGLTAVKTVNGESKGIAADTFTFGIEAVSAPQGAAADLPANAADDGTVKNGADGTIDFGAFTFSAEGDYVYRVTEVNEDKAGYSYDDTTYTVVFHVSDDPAQGALVATREIYKGTAQDDTARVDAVTFANTYHPEAAPATAAFSGTKSVTNEHGGFTMKAGQFSFTMTNTQAPAGVSAPTPGNGPTVANAADGSFSFGTLTFTEPGEYTYTVSEVNPADSSDAVNGITYDGTQYTLYFNVVDDNGTLKVETQTITSSRGGTADADALDFTNIYNDGQVSYQIAGTKMLDTNGFDGASLAEGQFSFVLVENGQTVQKVTNGAPAGNSAAFAFDPITYTEPGTHTYTVYEAGTDGENGTGGTDSNNITYSKEAYTVTVTVSRAAGAEGQHGGLSVTADVSNAEIRFTNEYVPTEVTVGPGGDVQIGGTKTLDVADGSRREMKEGEFTFLLFEGGQEIGRASNDADGNFVFDDIIYDYTDAGVHRYTVSEINNGLGGVEYDPTIYSVEVNVTENTETHALEAAITYYNNAGTADPADGMTFTNRYQASPAAVNLGVVKKLAGTALKDGQFTFRLTGSGGAPMPEKDTAVNAADGSVLFDTITFDSVGEYDYTITEVNDGQDGIIYDENADRTVHVSVTDNGTGSLEAKVTYGGDGSVITNTAKAAPPSDDSQGGNGGNNSNNSNNNNGPSRDQIVQTGDTAQILPVVCVLLGAFAVLISVSMIMIRRRRK